MDDASPAASEASPPAAAEAAPAGTGDAAPAEGSSDAAASAMDASPSAGDATPAPAMDASPVPWNFDLDGASPMSSGSTAIQLYETPDKKRNQPAAFEPLSGKAKAAGSTAESSDRPASSSGQEAAPKGPVRGHYDLLGIPRDAPLLSIRRAYRQMALKTHPDKGGDPEDFLRVMNAFETLSDRNRRAAYDLDLDKRQCQDGVCADASGAAGADPEVVDSKKSTRGLARAAFLELVRAAPGTWASRLGDLSISVLEALGTVLQQMGKQRRRDRNQDSGDFPREIAPPEGLPPGWKTMEYMYKSGKSKGLTYTRHNSPWGAKGFQSVASCITADAERKGVEADLSVLKRKRLSKGDAPAGQVPQKPVQKCIYSVRTQEGLKYWVNCNYSYFRVFTKRTASLQQAVDWHIALCAVKDAAQARMRAAPPGQPAVPMTQEELIQLLQGEPDLQLNFSSNFSKGSVSNIHTPNTNDLETAVMVYQRFQSMLEQTVNKSRIGDERTQACQDVARRADRLLELQFQLAEAVAQELEQRPGALQTLTRQQVLNDAQRRPGRPSDGDRVDGGASGDEDGNKRKRKKDDGAAEEDNAQDQSRKRRCQTSPDARAPDGASDEARDVKARSSGSGAKALEDVGGSSRNAVRHASRAAKARDALIDVLKLDTRGVEKLTRRLKEISDKELKRRLAILGMPADLRMPEMPTKRRRPANPALAQEAGGGSGEEEPGTQLALPSLGPRALQELAGQHGMRVMPQKKLQRRRTDGDTPSMATRSEAALALADRSWRHHAGPSSGAGQQLALGGPSTAYHSMMATWCPGLPEGVDGLAFFDITELCRLRKTSQHAAKVADQELAERFSTFRYEVGFLEKAQRTQRGRKQVGASGEAVERLVCFLMQPRHMAKFKDLDLSQAPTRALEDHRLHTTMGKMRRLEHIRLPWHGWGTSSERTKFVRMLPKGTEFTCVDARGGVMQTGSANVTLGTDR